MKNTVVTVLLVAMVVCHGGNIEVGWSHSLPLAGEKLLITVKGAPPGFSAEVTSPRDGQQQPVALQAAGNKLEMLPEEDGFYELALYGPDRTLLEKIEFPVLGRQIHIIFWDCPTTQRYVSARQIWPEKDGDFWLTRGTLNLTWAPGLKARPADKEALTGKYARRMQESDGILIDEFYMGNPEYYPYQCQTVCPAIADARIQVPDKKIYAWTASIDPECSTINQCIADSIDLIIMETYMASFLQYRRIAARHRAAVESGWAEKSIIGLGIGEDWITTGKEAAQQIQSTKEQLPDNAGIAFFGDGSRQEIMHAIDQSVRQYYLMPVLRLDKDRRRLSNFGGMTARGVKYEDAEGRLLTLAELAPTQSTDLGKTGCTLQKEPHYTILENGK